MRTIFLIFFSLFLCVKIQAQQTETYVKTANEILAVYDKESIKYFRQFIEQQHPVQAESTKEYQMTVKKLQEVKLQVIDATKKYYSKQIIKQLATVNSPNKQTKETIQQMVEKIYYDKFVGLPKEFYELCKEKVGKM